MRLIIGVVLLMLVGCVKPPALKGVYEGSLVVRSFCGTPEPSNAVGVKWTLTDKSLVSTGDWVCGPIQLTRKRDASYMSAAECPVRKDTSGIITVEHVRSGWVDLRKDGLKAQVKTDAAIVSATVTEARACAREYSGTLSRTGGAQ